MALFDSFSAADPTATALAQVQANNLAGWQRLQAGVPKNDRFQQNAVRLVEGLSGLAGAGVFGEKLKGEFSGENDPNVVHVRKAADLLKGIQALPGDPASSDYAKTAAKLALDANRPDIAFQFSQVAGERSKAEAKLAAEATQQTLDNQKNLFGALPSTGKLSLIVEHPDQISAMFGFTPEQTANFQEEARKSLDTMRLENAKKLADLKPLQVSPVTKQDTINALDSIKAAGIEPAKFGGYGEEELSGFAGHISQQVAAELDKAAQERRNVSAPVLQQGILKDLVDSGAVTLGDKGVLGFGGNGKKTIESVDNAKVTEVFKNRLGMAEATPAKAAVAAKEVVRQTAAGRKAVFDGNTKQFIRWSE